MNESLVAALSNTYDFPKPNIPILRKKNSGESRENFHSIRNNQQESEIDWDARLDFWIITGTLLILLFMALNVWGCLWSYQQMGPWAGVENRWCA